MNLGGPKPETEGPNPNKLRMTPTTEEEIENFDRELVPPSARGNEISEQ